MRRLVTENPGSKLAPGAGITAPEPPELRDAGLFQWSLGMQRRSNQVIAARTSPTSLCSDFFHDLVAFGSNTRLFNRLCGQSLESYSANNQALDPHQLLGILLLLQ